MWHAHPLIYPDQSVVFKRRNGYVTAEDIRKSDEDRIKELESMGYDVLIIWEYEYKKDKKGTIEKCLEFLKK